MELDSMFILLYISIIFSPQFPPLATLGVNLVDTLNLISCPLLQS